MSFVTMPLVTEFFTPARNPLGQSCQKCKHCPDKLFVWSVLGGNGSLRYHLNAEHKALFSAWQKATEDLSPAPTPARSRSSSAASSPAVRKRKRLSQGTALVRAFAAHVKSTADVDRLCAIAWATCRLSRRLLDNPHFLAWLLAWRQSSAMLPSGKKLRAVIATTSDGMRKDLLERLRNSSTPLGVAIDGWTNVRHDKITNILLISNGVAFYWCSIVNSRERNTAPWLHGQMKRRLCDLLAAGIRFASFVADNEATMGALFDLLLVDFPFLVRVPCAAHTIQLIVKNSMESERWAKVREEFDDIIKGFVKNKETRLELKTLHWRRWLRRFLLCRRAKRLSSVHSAHRTRFTRTSAIV
jgi:hypothetical protein